MVSIIQLNEGDEMVPVEQVLRKCFSLAMTNTLLILINGGFKEAAKLVISDAIQSEGLVDLAEFIDGQMAVDRPAEEDLLLAEVLELVRVEVEVQKRGGGNA